MFTSEVKVLTEEGVPEKTAANQINGLFERAGLEIAIRNFWRLPVLATEKFFMGHDEPRRRASSIMRSEANSERFTS